MGRLGNHKEEIETPMSEQEKTDFVSGKFLYAITDFSLFKRGEAYWLEYIGNDTYCCRSDNLLNVKIKINPWELKRYFSEEPLHPLEDILSEFAYHVRTWGLTDGESNVDFCNVQAHRWAKEMIKTENMTQEELKEILEGDEIRDTWEYVQEFVEKFGKIPEDQDELVVCVNYVLECMQGNHQISATDEWQVAEGLYKCTKRMFDGTPEGKILFEVGEVYKCLSKHDIAEFEVSYGHSVFLIDPVVRKHFIPLDENK